MNIEPPQNVDCQRIVPHIPRSTVLHRWSITALQCVNYATWFWYLISLEHGNKLGAFAQFIKNHPLISLAALVVLTATTLFLAWRGMRKLRIEEMAESNKRRNCFERNVQHYLDNCQNILLLTDAAIVG